MDCESRRFQQFTSKISVIDVQSAYSRLGRTAIPRTRRQRSRLGERTPRELRTGRNCRPSRRCSSITTVCYRPTTENRCHCRRSPVRCDRIGRGIRGGVNEQSSVAHRAPRWSGKVSISAQSPAPGLCGTFACFVMLCCARWCQMQRAPRGIF
jgi:hypothetical protein